MGLKKNKIWCFLIMINVVISALNILQVTSKRASAQPCNTFSLVSCQGASCTPSCSGTLGQDVLLSSDLTPTETWWTAICWQ